MINVFINDYLIPESDVISISDPATEKLQFNFSNLISATLSVDLNNIDTSKYDDEIEGSLFYGDWYNLNIRCIDTDTDLTIWNGRIKNIKKNDSKAVITIESNNYIKEIVDTVCEISLGSLSNATPSEVIYQIIKDVCGIPESAINITSFDIAKAIQIANSGYIITTYTKEANVNCGAVLNEVLRITSSYLYTVNNILYYSQFQLYNGDLNQLIDEDQIIAGSYSSEYVVDKIFNDYSIVYKSSDSLVAYATPDTIPDYITSSKTKYGTKKFLVPNDEVKESTPASYKILLKSITSAKYYGELVRSSSHSIKKVVSLTVSDEVKDVNLNSMIDLNYKHLTREPMRVIERKVVPKKHTINIKTEMINFPFAVINRDKVKPNVVYLMEIIYNINNEVELFWTSSSDLNLKNYIIEFSTSITDFDREYSDQGYSPLPITEPEMKNGLCTYKLSGLQDNSIYYFRIKVMDTSWNISDPSNTLTLYIPAKDSRNFDDISAYYSFDDSNNIGFDDSLNNNIIYLNKDISSSSTEGMFNTSAVYLNGDSETYFDDGTFFDSDEIFDSLAHYMYKDDQIITGSDFSGYFFINPEEFNDKSIIFQQINNDIGTVSNIQILTKDVNDYAVRFIGNSGINAGNVANYTSNFSISFKVRKDTAPSLLPESIMQRVSTTTGFKPFDIRINNSGRIELFNRIQLEDGILVGYPLFTLTDSSICNGEWNHIFINIISNNQAECFVNGISQGIKVNYEHSLFETEDANLRIGYGDTFPETNLDLDDIIIFKRTLIESEIQDLYLYNIKPLTSSDILHYDFNDLDNLTHNKSYTQNFSTYISLNDEGILSFNVEKDYAKSSRSSAIPLNQWSFVYFDYFNNNLRLFVNSDWLESSENESGFYVLNEMNNFIIGKYFKGRLDEFTFRTNKLNNKERKFVMNNSINNYIKNI